MLTYTDSQQNMSSYTLYPPDKAAKFLGLSERTLARLRKDGTGPAFIVVQGLVRYPAAALAAFVEAKIANGTGVARSEGAGND